MLDATPKPIRVAYLIVDLEIGGAQRVLERLVTHIDRTRFHPIVISLRATGPIVHELARHGIRVVSLGMRSMFDIPAALELNEILRDFKPHILHTHLFHANVIGAIAGRIARVPHIVTTVHALEAKFYHRPLERHTWRLCDRVVFVAEAIGRHARMTAGMEGRRCSVIYNGVPEPVVAKPGVKTELRLAESRIVATATRLIPRKGAQVFIRMAKLLAPRFPDVRFVIIGGGELDGALRSLTRDLGIESVVHFAGWRDDVTRSLIGADVFVFASKYGEGLPTVVVEAMMAGVPVVATDIAGTREAIVDGETGILLKSRDDQVVADAVASLLLDSAKARSMGQKGRERAREVFSLAAMVERHEELYAKLLGRG